MALIFVYLLIFAICFNNYKKRFLITEDNLKPCVAWAKSQGYPIPRRPGIIEFFLIEGKFHWMIFPFGFILFLLPSSKNVVFYKQEMIKLMDKWDYWIKTANATRSRQVNRPSKPVNPPEEDLTNFKELFERANKKISEANTEGAIIDYTKAIQKEPDEAFLYRFRGLAKKESGDIHGACKDWLMAEKLGDKESTILLKKHPKIVSDIYRSKGIVKRELGDLKGAFNQWEKASQLGDEEASKLIKKYSEELNKDENKKNLEDLWSND